MTSQFSDQQFNLLWLLNFLEHLRNIVPLYATENDEILHTISTNIIDHIRKLNNILINTNTPPTGELKQLYQELQLMIQVLTNERHRLYTASH